MWTTQVCTYQWYVIHTEDNNSLMFGGVFRYPAKVGLQNVVAVQERHLAIRLDPHLQTPS